MCSLSFLSFSPWLLFICFALLSLSLTAYSLFSSDDLYILYPSRSILLSIRCFSRSLVSNHLCLSLCSTRSVSNSLAPYTFLLLHPCVFFLFLFLAFAFKRVHTLLTCALHLLKRSPCLGAFFLFVVTLLEWFAVSRRSVFHSTCFFTIFHEYACFHFTCDGFSFLRRCSLSAACSEWRGQSPTDRCCP